MAPSPSPGRRPEIPFSPPVPLEALAARTFILQPPSRSELSSVMRPEAAALCDSLLARVARSRGALDVAMGQGLDALSKADAFVQLGYSCLGDYAREVLGVAGRTAQAMAQLARELGKRPLLRDAVRRGEVSARKALAILPVALGEAEAGWVERARGLTVRALEAAVREERSGAGADGCAADGSRPGSSADDDEWERLYLSLSRERRPRLDEALSLAGRILGPTSPKWQRVEAIGQEYVGSHPGPPDPREELPPDRPWGDWVGCRWVDGSRAETLGAPVPVSQEGLRTWLEQEMRCWWFLESVEPVEAPKLGSLEPCPEGRDAGSEGAAAAERGRVDPSEVDAELRSLAALRDRWDELLGHLAMLVRYVGLWRDMQFASFSHYCEERLGMAARTVEQRVWLSRKLYELPALRLAMREGRVSYEKARLLAGCAGEGTQDAWIEKAEKTTCIALRREVEAMDEKQMCAQGHLSLLVPRRVAELLAEAFRAVRAEEKRWLTEEECLLRLCDHFIEVWKDLPRGRSTPQRRVIERDRGLCQVPGCSKPAAHAHHVRYRSQGGGDEAENLVSLCAVHHLRAVHMGRLIVRGAAPDDLEWEVRPTGKA